MDTARLTEATFALLPSELLSMIGDFLDNIHDLSNLARVSQPFYRAFNRLLYKAAVEDHHPGPTIEAASNGNLGALKLAAEHGANLDYYQVKPLTADEKLAKGIPYQLSPRARWGAPLHFAIIYGHQHVVEWLISKGVDIEAPARLYCGCVSPWNDISPYHETYRTDYDKGVMVWTPLHYAICHRQTDIAHLLSADCLIRTMELLRVQGAWKDAREQNGRISTEEKSSWTLAGTTVKGEKCSELSGQWNKLGSDELKIIPSKCWHIFKKIRWENDLGLMV
ncbi:hypothetical protein CGCA056_v011088 [Colletotrichum aenigma]|uniref:uncharacterized protein n=1 Tax=Colletotrichum aenigma TaxID=1215731 RepID=UPI0018732A2F|nr:uncharacterized protein CGCA056_v011088 [Colletotrichum aenigma]KAF5518127.1 hypothetical protein CGCA056_v011088 [Colletotrichum aenigma]